MKSIYLLIYTVLVLFGNPTWAGLTEQKMHVPVIVKGEQIKALLGRKIDNIRVYAFHRGSPVLIPFQIDQKDSEGNWVWEQVSNADRHEMKNFDNEDSKGENIFDSNDQLVFMAKDMGEKSDKPSLKIDYSELLELKTFIGESKAYSGWVYITYHSLSVPEKSTTRYMQYQPDKNVVKSPVYSLTYSKKYLATMEDMTISGHSVINQTRINGKVELGLLFLNSSVEFNEKEIDGYSVGYINGPIRTIKRFITYIKLGAGIKSMSMDVDHIFYPNHTEVPVLITKGLIVKNMAIKIGANYPPTDSCQVYNQSLKTLTQLNNSRAEISLQTNDRPQLLTLNSSSYSMLTLLKIPKELREKLNTYAFINNETPFQDTKKKSSAENKLAGFYLKTRDDFPSGQYKLNVISIFSDKPDIYKKTDLINKKVSVVASKIKKMSLPDYNPGLKISQSSSLNKMITH
ncbi:MAG: hypothetical protein QNL62_01625 [Gammaproteobacteria bacterium]|nr:hypothetical protein [Gammaproteobacteria bacterium]